MQTSARHDQRDALALPLEEPDVAQRIAVNDDQVGKRADAHRPQFPRLLQQFGVVRGRLLQDLGRRFPPHYLHQSWLDYLYWDIELEP